MPRYSNIWMLGSITALLFLSASGRSLADTPATAPTTQPATRPEVADDVLAAFKPMTVERDGKTALRYRVLAPPNPQPGKNFPLVLFLHGGGERGDDNYRQLIHGGAEFLRHSARYPAFYVFPQCPKGTWWSTLNKLRDEKVTDPPPPPMDEIVALIETMLGEYPIDHARVYVAGLSMGGFGTYEIVAIRPTLFAAAIPMCGGGDLALVDRYRSTPFWIFHGDADTAVNVTYSREMSAAMRSAGVPFIYTEYPGGNHNAWTPTLNNDAVIDWLFAQRRQ